MRMERPLGDVQNVGKACLPMIRMEVVPSVQMLSQDVFSVTARDVLAVQSLMRFLRMMARVVKKSLTIVMSILKTMLLTPILTRMCASNVKLLSTLTGLK